MQPSVSTPCLSSQSSRKSMTLGESASDIEPAPQVEREPPLRSSLLGQSNGAVAADVLPPTAAALGALWTRSASAGELQQQSRPSAVRVVVRFRPPVSQEEHAEVRQAFHVDGEASVRSSDYSQQFFYDRALDQDTTQEAVYADVGRPVVDDVLEGYHGTILAYGQTGSGKTYCMFGPQGSSNPLESQGLIPRAARQIFDGIAMADVSGGGDYTVQCSFFEVYCEQLRDLLRPNEKPTTKGSSVNLQVKEMPKHGFYVDGLTHRTVHSANEALQVLRGGLRFRAASHTTLNHHSSRSHAIFNLIIQQRLGERSEAIGLPEIKQRKLTLVDLAGSEKVHKSGCTGEMLEEAKKINSSLSALGNVIDALADRRPHVPYRDSRLTRILEDSLGGNCRTTLLVACSPSANHSAETLSSLRFAARAKKVCNYVRLNTNHSMAMADRQLLQRIAQLQHDLASAHRDLEKRLTGNLVSGLSSSPRSPSRHHRTLLRSWTEDAVIRQEASRPDIELLRGLQGLTASQTGLQKSVSSMSTSSLRPSSPSRSSTGDIHSASAPAGRLGRSEGSRKNSQQGFNHTSAAVVLALAASPVAGASREDRPSACDKSTVGSDGIPSPPSPISPGGRIRQRLQTFENSCQGRSTAMDRTAALSRSSGPLPSGSASITTTGSAASSCSSAGVGKSQSSTSLAFNSALATNSPTATPLSSWRNLDDDDLQLGLSWSGEDGSNCDHTRWFQKQLEIERRRCASLSDELSRRIQETDDLQRELETTRQIAKSRGLSLQAAQSASVSPRKVSHVARATSPIVVAAAPSSVVAPPGGLQRMSSATQVQSGVCRRRSASPVPVQFAPVRLVGTWAGPVLPAPSSGSRPCTPVRTNAGRSSQSSVGRTREHLYPSLSQATPLASGCTVAARPLLSTAASSSARGGRETLYVPANKPVPAAPNVSGISAPVPVKILTGPIAAFPSAAGASWPTSPPATSPALGDALSRPTSSQASDSVVVRPVSPPLTESEVGSVAAPPTKIWSPQLQ